MQTIANPIGLPAPSRSVATPATAAPFACAEPIAARIYYVAKRAWIASARRLSVIGARFIRFLAIPYAMATRINWDECAKNGFLVYLDHLYIFFRLGYYPDNYGQCRFWEKDRREWKYYWGSGYDPYVTSLLYRKVQRRDAMVLFEDKEVCYQLCQSYGLPLPLQYGALSPGDDLPATIRDLFANRGAHKVMLKPVGGAGGKGIAQVERIDGNLAVRRNREPERLVALDGFSIDTRCVIQERLAQHPALDLISPFSLNTTRIVTLMTPENEIVLLGAYVRFSTGRTFVDNICLGGCSVAIDVETGESDDQTHNQRSLVRPLSSVSSGAVTRFTMPYWNELVALARKVQTHFAPFSRLLGMDIGMTPSGPVLIEINFGYDNNGIESTCGPILKIEAVRHAFLAYGIISHRLFQARPAPVSQRRNRLPLG